MYQRQPEIWHKRAAFFAFGILLLIVGSLLSTCLYTSSQVDVSKLNTLSIVVRRVTNGQDNTSPIIFQKTLYGSQQVQKIFHTITALHQVTAGDNYNCPTGMPPYEFIDMRFQQNKAIVAEATIEVIACTFWYVKDVSSGSTEKYCCASNAQWIPWKKEFGLPDFDSTKLSPHEHY